MQRASPYLRYSLATAATVVATSLIFLLMYRLIGTGPKIFDTETIVASINIYQAEPVAETPPPPQPETVMPDMPKNQVLEPSLAPLSIAPPAPVQVLNFAGAPVSSFAPTFDDISLSSGSGGTFGSGDGTDPLPSTWLAPGDDGLAKKIAAADAKGKDGYKEVLPLSTRQPNIPEEAWNKKIDGWVLVAFTVNAFGRVENVRVLDAQPRGLFEDNVIASVRDWVYDPADFKGRKVKAQLTQRIELYWKDYPNNNKQLY